jgi:heme A synthase
VRTYRIFAYLVALEVFVQAATHAYTSAGLGHWIYSDGHTVTKATLEEGSGVDFTGRWAGIVHGENGAMIVPLLAIAFLVVGIVTRKQVHHGLRWAAILLGLVVLQVALGFITIAVPEVGMLHAVNALVLLLTALHAALLPARGPSAEHAPEAASEVDPTAGGVRSRG